MGRSSRPRHAASGLGRNAPGAQQAKQEEADASDEASDARRRAAAYCGTLEQDKELLAIFERTYGPIKRRGEAAGQHDQLAARKAFRSVGPSQNRTPRCTAAQRAGVPAGRRLQRDFLRGMN